IFSLLEFEDIDVRTHAVKVVASLASEGGAFGGRRGLQPIPPEKGVFPLDHFQECQHVMKQYLACLQDNKHEAEKCRSLSKSYLQCRMERNLMAKQDLSQLGFSETSPSRDLSDGLSTKKET
ncbi:hypothetical protein GOP47_0016355, partial [Adiantum capillus-veneris]